MGKIEHATEIRKKPDERRISYMTLHVLYGGQERRNDVRRERLTSGCGCAMEALREAACVYRTIVHL